MTEEDDVPNNDTVSSVLSLWQSVTDSINPEKKDARYAYKKRLESFRPDCYFAKPLCVSPLIAARFGWFNGGKDTLVCRECQAVVVITFHPTLREKGVASLCRSYRKQMATSHTPDCSFRSDAERHLLSTRPQETLVPSHFADVIPRETLAMVESPVPGELIRQRTREWIDSIPGDSATLTISQLVQPLDEMETYGINKESLSERFLKKLEKESGHDEDDTAPQHWVTATMLTMFGWLPHLVATANDERTLTMGCDLCLAKRIVRLGRMEEDTSENAEIESESEQENGPSSVGNKRPAKRPRITTHNRKIDPVSSHRYYCPYVAGFYNLNGGHSEPLWKVVVRNFCNSEADEANKEAGPSSDSDVIYNVRQILRSGISKASLAEA